MENTPVKINENTDYTDEYKNYLRCPNCKKPTTGIEQFQNIRSGNITKTCFKCRDAIYTSYKKKPRLKKKTITMRDKMGLLRHLVNRLKEDDKSDIIKQDYRFGEIFKSIE